MDLPAIENAAGLPGVMQIESSIERPDELADAEIWHEGDPDAAMEESSTARDMWITSAAKMRLMTNSETPGLETDVDASDGVVTLFGTVPSEQSKQPPASEVGKVDGVLEVKNDLQVVAEAESEQVAAEDDEIRSAIEGRLESRDDLAGSDIDVEVRNGVARLTGSVRSRVDRVTALTVAGATDGVRAVQDDPTLAPPEVSAR